MDFFATAARGTEPALRDELRELRFRGVRADRGGVHFAGPSLHRRGYRTHIGEAPLKETLAAALLRLSGWDRVRPFLDPMCGAGTIAVEAALWARGIAPGLLGAGR